jgi:hypothetical protein
VEVCVSKEKALHDFIVEAWPKSHGDKKTLDAWIKKAYIAFPDSDLIGEAKRAFMWEAARPSREKKSARRFLSNWWVRSTKKLPYEVPKATPLGAVRWLKRHNKEPDYLFESWARGKDVTPQAVLEFCGYMGADPPESCKDVVSVFLEGV